MRVAAVIIAGGSSTRMGRDKALIDLAGKPVIRWITERIAPQVAAMAINANADRFASFGLTIIPDRRSAIGTPLAGLHAGLRWVRDEGFDALLTVPSDSPFLPRDLVQRLAGEGPAIATSGGQSHYLTGLWSHTLLGSLEKAIDTEGLRRVQDWARHCGARAVDWPAAPFDPFFNINTPEDLAVAERIAAEFNP